MEMLLRLSKIILWWELLEYNLIVVFRMGLFLWLFKEIKMCKLLLVHWDLIPMKLDLRSRLPTTTLFSKGLAEVPLLQITFLEPFALLVVAQQI